MKKNKTFFAFGNPVGVALASVLLIACVVSHSVMASSLPRIALCSCYSEASFAYMAEQTSLSEAPWLEGIDSVYVLNPHSEGIRYFDVHRWYDDGYQPQGMGRKGTSGVATMQGYFRAEAVPGTGNPEIINSISSANDAVKSFAFQLQGGISIGDLGLPFDSAVSLAGPEDSAAGYRRGALRNELNAHMNGTWNLIKLALDDLALRAAGKILSSSQVSFLKNLTIEFPDGTIIQVEVVEIQDGVMDSDIFFELKVRTDTIHGPGLSHVPQSAGQFNGFYFSGSGLTIQELIRLAQLYGIPITGPGVGDSDEGNFECEIEGSTVRCRVSGK